MITTYDELVAAVADWLNRADLDSVIPTFVQLCDAQLRRRIKTKYTNRLDMTILADNVGVETIPGDRPDEILSLYITTPSDYEGAINPVSPQFLWNHRRGHQTSARPMVAAIIDQEILFSAIPDQDYEAQLVIEGPLVPLSDSNQSNYVLEHAPDAYLYGSLVQSSPYLQQDERIGTWATKFEMVIAELEAERLRNEWPNTPVAPVPKAYGESYGRHGIYP